MDKPTPGDFDETSKVSGLADLVGAVIGKEVNTTDKSGQDTTATSTQTGTTTGTTDQTTTGTQTGTQTGTTQQVQAGQTVNNSVGSTFLNGVNKAATSSVTNENTKNVSDVTGTQSSSTTGTTGSTGKVSNTGTNITDTSGQVLNNSTTKTTADVSGLRDVFAKQSAGVTSDMIKAIFEEGARAAPNLIRAHSNAVGARDTNNSAVATSLGDLETKLTRQVADLNRQLLGDAGNTAAKIAENTRESNTTGSTSQSSVAKNVQDLLTQTDTQTVMAQLANAITANHSVNTAEKLATTKSETDSSTEQTGGSTNSTSGLSKQITDASSQQNTAQNLVNSVIGKTTGTSAATGTQTQNVSATDNKKVATTINTDVAKKIAAGAAAGLGLATLYKMAKDAGFLGKASDFVKSLKASGTPIAPATQLELDNAAAADAGGGLTLQFGSQEEYDKAINMNLDSGGGEVVDTFGDFSGPEFIDDTSGMDLSGFFADGGQVKMADGGGLNFLAIPDLITKKPTPTIDTSGNIDISSTLKQLSGDSGSSGTKDATTAVTGGDGPGTGSSSAGSSSGTGGFSLGGVSLGQAASLAASIASGNVPGMVASAVSIANSMSAANTDSIAAAAAAAAADADAAAAAAAAAADADAAAADSSGLASSDGGGEAAGGGGDAGVVGGDGGASASDGGGEAAGGGGDAGDSGLYADGGMPDDGDGKDSEDVADRQHEAMMEAMGITRDGKGGLQFNDHAVRVMHKAMTGGKKPKMMADGGTAVYKQNKNGSPAANYSAKPVPGQNEYIGTAGPGNTGIKRNASTAGAGRGGVIKGPGTGISDSIPADGPGGSKLKVSNNEYILPADTVEAIGVDVLDKIVADTHVPADLQRAMFGE